MMEMIMTSRPWIKQVILLCLKIAFWVVDRFL